MNSFSGKGSHFCICLPCCDVWGSPHGPSVVWRAYWLHKERAFPQGDGHPSVCEMAGDCSGKKGQKEE